MVAVVPAARGELGCRVRVRRWLLVASRIDSVPPLDMQPHTPGSPASPPPSMAAVIATTSASNFETEGHVEEWSGFETANIEAASFRTAMCCSSPEYTAPLSCPRFQRPSSCSLNPAIMPSSSTSATPELGSARWVFRGLGGAAMGWWWVPATCQLAPASHPVACLPAVAGCVAACCCSCRVLQFETPARPMRRSFQREGYGGVSYPYRVQNLLDRAVVRVHWRATCDTHAIGATTIRRARRET